jgi:hypothetical protein
LPLDELTDDVQLLLNCRADFAKRFSHAGGKAHLAKGFQNLFEFGKVQLVLGTLPFGEALFQLSRGAEQRVSFVGWLVGRVSRLG